MKLGLNACGFIVLMLIAGLATAVPADRATACTGYYWDNNAKRMVCVDVSTATKPILASSSAPKSCMWSWDTNTKQMVCVDLSRVAPRPTTSAPSSFMQQTPSYYQPSYTNSPGPGYHYYSKICTRLCGCQYNVWVNFDYNCANDIPA